MTPPAAAHNARAMQKPPFTARLWAELKPGGTFAEAIRGATPRDADVLEIGPGAAPAFRRRDYPHLKVSDYCDSAALREQLQRQYPDSDLAPDLFDDIDYVCGDSRLAAVVPPGQRFDLIFSAHNIEHQPDLLEHLRSLQALLKPDGAAALIIPHKQRTFDLFRQPTTTSDVLMAHYGPPGLMSAKTLFDADSHCAVAPPGVEHRFGPDDPVVLGELAPAYERLRAVLQGEQAHPTYVHHQHAFTPDSLQTLLIELYQLRLCTLLASLVSGAVGNSFMAVLQTVPWPEDPAEAAAHDQRLRALRLGQYRRMAFPGR